MDKKQIAIITPGILPVPCTKGGAVENLIEFYLQENEKRKDFYFHVYSIYDRQAKILAAKYKYVSFHFFNPQTFFIRLKRYIYNKTHSNFYYNPYMDYYGNWAIKQLQRNEIQLLIIENRQGFILNESIKLKCPKILHLHNDSLNKGSFLAKTILKKYDKILTVSHYIKKQVDDIASNNKTKTIYNGINLNKFSSPKSLYSRKDWELNDDDFVVIYAGRISPIKGIRELIEAFIRLKQYPNIKLLIVGGNNYGEINNDSFFSEMKLLSNESKKQIIFTGYIPYNNIPSILKLGNIGIIPSICEDAFTLSSVESMASGLPLIVTKSGGIPEAVDENCAIIINKDKDLIKSIAQSIIHLYKNPEKVKKMSMLGRKRSKLFSHTKYTENFLSELSEIMKNINLTNKSITK